MLSWKDLEIVIPSVLSSEGRANTLRNLLVQISQQCPGVLVRILPQYHRPNDLAKNAFDVLSEGLRNFSGRPWVILIEDDVELAPNFGEGVPPVLEEHPEAGAISFFSQDKHDVLALANKDIRYYDVPDSFAYSQCVAFRKEAIEGWAERMLDWHAKCDRYATPDLSISDCLNDMGFKLIVSLPSLVQHIVMKSAFNHVGTAKRQAPTFTKENK